MRGKGGNLNFFFLNTLSRSYIVFTLRKIDFFHSGMVKTMETGYEWTKKLPTIKGFFLSIIAVAVLKK